MSEIHHLPFIKGPSAEGRRLSPHIQHDLEASLNKDLSRVRVHEGHEATHFNADAVTTGNDIFFAPGKFQQNTDSGRELLNREIESIAQHQAGKVKPLARGLVEATEKIAA
jgi:hypothetical protein